MDNWAIIDQNGIVHQGKAEEINVGWVVMCDGAHVITDDPIKQKALEKQWGTTWKGDLMLVQIFGTYR